MLSYDLHAIVFASSVAYFVRFIGSCLSKDSQKPLKECCSSIKCVSDQ